MIKITYGVALLLLAGWAVGFLVFHAGHAIHLLLIGSMIAVLINIMREW